MFGRLGFQAQTAFFGLEADDAMGRLAGYGIEKFEELFRTYTILFYFCCYPQIHNPMVSRSLSRRAVLDHGFMWETCEAFCLSIPWSAKFDFSRSQSWLPRPKKLSIAFVVHVPTCQCIESRETLKKVAMQAQGCCMLVHGVGATSMNLKEAQSFPARDSKVVSPPF